MNRRRLAILCLTLGTLLLAGAAVWGLCLRQEEADAGRLSAEAVSLLKEAMEAEPAPSREAPSPEEPAAAPSAGMPETPEEETPAVREVGGRSYIGVLELPALGLELPVLKDWDQSGLKVAPCRWSGAPETGLIIAAHNYKRHFGRLEKLAEGDAAVFTTVEGKRLAFTVEAITIVSPDEGDRLKEECRGLTLVTCTYGGRFRVAVRCRPAA